VTRGRLGHLAVALAAATGVGACQHKSGAAKGGAQHGASTDSLQGVVRIVGVDTDPQVTLAFDNGGAAVTLVGAASLRHIDGLRVAVVGSRDGPRLSVSRFIVVAANGVAATDGTLSAEGETLVLVTADGTRHRLVGPSPALRAAIGHRVWVSGPLDSAPVAYGIIE
jgi:hypothetical protein